MSILQEILTWSRELPPWQSDAIARLIARHELSADDIDDLYALLKVQHGIPDPKGRTPAPLLGASIPAVTGNTGQVSVLAIKNLKHVNAMAGNQCLSLGSAGFTVIYGDNGSGKSGYSRVLKQACRARDRDEKIHSNATLPAAQADVAEAEFEVSVNGSARNLRWRNGSEAPPELSSVAIFDSRCARAYLDDEDDFSYVPYGLDVFERLGKLFKKLRAMLEDEYQWHTVDLSAFDHLKGDTEVGRAVSLLSTTTQVSRIESLVSLTEAETSLCAQLALTLKENNPKEKARELRLRARRVDGIAAVAARHFTLLKGFAKDRVRPITENLHAANVAAALAAEQFKRGEAVLPGTGGDAWRSLFEAARRFSVESACDASFPNLGPRGLCPLCQQPLGEGVHRLIRFDQFINAEAEKEVKKQRALLDTELSALNAQKLTIDVDEVTYLELGALDADLARHLRQYNAELDVVQRSINSAVVSNIWDDTEFGVESPVQTLQVWVQKLDEQALALEKAGDEVQRTTLQKRYAELDARIRLRESKGAVLNALAKLGHQAKLKLCGSSVKTNGISSKATELSQRVISSGLADALNREFRALGVGDLSVGLHSRTDKGKQLHKLRVGEKITSII